MVLCGLEILLPRVRSPSLPKSPGPRGGHKGLISFFPLSLSLFFFFFFLPHRASCGILVPQPGIEPGPSVVTVQSPNRWTVREVPLSSLDHKRDGTRTVLPLNFYLETLLVSTQALSTPMEWII